MANEQESKQTVKLAIETEEGGKREHHAFEGSGAFFGVIYKDGASCGIVGNISLSEYALTMMELIEAASKVFGNEPMDAALRLIMQMIGAKRKTSVDDCASERNDRMPR